MGIALSSGGFYWLADTNVICGLAAMDPLDPAVLEWFLEDSTADVLPILLRELDSVPHRGSVPGRAQRVQRDIASGHSYIVRDYLGPNPVFTEAQFRRRYRLPRDLVCQIMTDIVAHDPWMRQRADCTGHLGASTEQKVTAALRMLAYGTSSDAIEEYVRISGALANDCLKHFVACIVEMYGEEYLRIPNKEDVEKILEINASRGFPGMLGSVDCMHWFWDKCPRAWAGQMTGKDGKPSLVLEAVATSDLWIWHCFFGMAGSANDLNILERSPLLNIIYTTDDRFKCDYTLNGTTRNTPYYLADGIYPDWTAFVKTLSAPATAKEKFFAAMQESLRKDVERAFGALQARWHILARPSKLWFGEDMALIVKACVILHSMLIAYDRQHGPVDEDLESAEDQVPFVQAASPQLRRCEIDDLATNIARVRDRHGHNQLRHDLVEHLWFNHGYTTI